MGVAHHSSEMFGGTLIVPTLPRGNDSLDALRPLWNVTRSVTGCIPTQSVGTIMATTPHAVPDSFDYVQKLQPTVFGQ
jgi:hypothetical protein